MRTEKMEIIAVDLLMLNSLEVVAARHSISKSALYNLRKKEAFRVICAAQKTRIFGEASAKLQGYTLEVVETLIDIIRSPTTLDANKINAIRILLDNSRGAYEREEILPKLEELEKLMNSIEMRK